MQKCAAHSPDDSPHDLPKPRALPMQLRTGRATFCFFADYWPAMLRSACSIRRLTM